jgi:hypothetical protein
VALGDTVPLAMRHGGDHATLFMLRLLSAMEDGSQKGGLKKILRPLLASWQLHCGPSKDTYTVYRCSVSE